MLHIRPIRARGHRGFDDHEEVVAAVAPESGLRAFVAIHSTARGPAFGGCRMLPYEDEAAALADALRLSRGMTFKAAVCDLPYGGGKAVVMGEPVRDKSPALLLALGRLIESLGGRYVVADDVGITLGDLLVLRAATAHTAAATRRAQASLAVTAYGVLAAMRAAVRHHLRLDRFSGTRVAIQGLGQVGFALARYLHREGAELVVADLDPDRARRAVDAFGARAVAPGDVLTEPADVVAPCALGGVLDERNAALLRAKIICGGANNQLNDERLDSLLAGRGILYVPDYLAGAGGVIDFHQEQIDDRSTAVLRAVGRLENITSDLLQRAAAGGRTLKEEADDLVRKRLEQAHLGKGARATHERVENRSYPDPAGPGPCGR